MPQEINYGSAMLEKVLHLTYKQRHQFLDIAEAVFKKTLAALKSDQMQRYYINRLYSPLGRKPTGAAMQLLTLMIFKDETPSATFHGMMKTLYFFACHPRFLCLPPETVYIGMEDRLKAQVTAERKFIDGE